MKAYVYIHNCATSSPVVSPNDFRAFAFPTREEGELYLQTNWGMPDGKLSAPYDLRPLTDIDEVLWPIHLQRRFGKHAKHLREQNRRYLQK